MSEGGSISTRKDMVSCIDKKSRIQDELEKKSDFSKSYWTHCALTGDLLKAPIILTKTGLFMNKMPLVELMLKKKIPSEFQYIKSIKKDVCDVDLIGSHTLTEYSCPLSQISPDNNHNFLLLWKCGHLFEESAFKKIKEANKTSSKTGDEENDVCPYCGKKYREKHIIPLCSFSFSTNKIKQLAEKKKDKKPSKD